MENNLIGGPFTRISYEPMNLNSSDQVKAYLFANGWVPDEYNFKKNDRGFVEKDENGDPIKTSPKLTESSFHTVKGEIPGLLARRNVLMHRKRMLKNVRGTDGEETGLINIIREDGRISASCIPNATNTGRAVHRNVVNIPGVAAIYGADIRSLFVVPDGYQMLGIDASALEGRCLAHAVMPYPGGRDIADIILDGDVHQANADLWGCTRKEAKSPFYALLFGAQPPKLAVTMGCGIERAKGIYNDFWSHYSALDQFKTELTQAWESRGGKKGGYVRGLDGRKLFARSQHSLVNLYIQSSGSILVKTAMIFIAKRIKQAKLDAHQILWIHDELEYEVANADVDRLIEITEQSFLDSGRYWKFRVPLVGEAKVGTNWKNCH